MRDFDLALKVIDPLLECFPDYDSFSLSEMIRASNLTLLDQELAFNNDAIESLLVSRLKYIEQAGKNKLIFKLTELGRQVKNQGGHFAYLKDRKLKDNERNGTNTYNVYGQAGAVGPNSIAHGNTFNQVNYTLPADTNFDLLAAELSTLKQALINKATSGENYRAISEVVYAEEAAKSKNGNKVVTYLKAAGKLVYDVAKEIGTDVAAEVIIKSIGL